MTRKTAKKSAARARQEKTGQAYASALRDEGGPDNIIHKRREGMLRMFDEALDHCEAALDREKFDGPPMFSATIEFVFPNKKRIMSLPAWHLREPVPNPMPGLRAEPVPEREPINPADPETRINMAFSVLNNGLYHQGFNAPTREGLYGRIQHALHILLGSSDEMIREAIEKGQFEPPSQLTEAELEGLRKLTEEARQDPDFKVIENPGGFTPKSALEGFKVNPPPLRGWGLDEEVPLPNDPTPTVKENLDPQQLWDYWKMAIQDGFKVYRITDSKRLLLGVTDDYPEKPLITWTRLTATKSCQGFGEWWHSLPESSIYDRTVHPV